MDFNLEQIWPLLLAAILVVTVFGAIAIFSDGSNLNGIKSRLGYHLKSNSKKGRHHSHFGVKCK